MRSMLEWPTSGPVSREGRRCLRATDLWAWPIEPHLATSRPPTPTRARPSRRRHRKGIRRRDSGSFLESVRTVQPQAMTARARRAAPTRRRLRTRWPVTDRPLPPPRWPANDRLRTRCRPVQPSVPREARASRRSPSTPTPRPLPAGCTPARPQHQRSGPRRAPVTLTVCLSRPSSQLRAPARTPRSCMACAPQRCRHRQRPTARSTPGSASRPGRTPPPRRHRRPAPPCTSTSTGSWVVPRPAREPGGTHPPEVRLVLTTWEVGLCGPRTRWGATARTLLFGI